MKEALLIEQECTRKSICADAVDNAVNAELVTWAQSKGLSQLSPGMLLEPSFADGRLLCRLVELLTRCSLPRIEWHGPSIAASRHNIAKVWCAAGWLSMELYSPCYARQLHMLRCC